jgi:hypothetical protein
VLEKARFAAAARPVVNGIRQALAAHFIGAQKIANEVNAVRAVLLGVQIRHLKV